jgi:hypothetical protein
VQTILVLGRRRQISSGPAPPTGWSAIATPWRERGVRCAMRAVGA